MLSAVAGLAQEGGPGSGAAAGVPIAVMLGPTELVKCRLQVAETARMGRDVRSAVRFILVTEGWRGLMRGTGLRRRQWQRACPLHRRNGT